MTLTKPQQQFPLLEAGYKPRPETGSNNPSKRGGEIIKMVATLRAMSSAPNSAKSTSIAAKIKACVETLSRYAIAGLVSNQMRLSGVARFGRELIVLNSPFSPSFTIQGSLDVYNLIQSTTNKRGLRKLTALSTAIRTAQKPGDKRDPVLYSTYASALLYGFIGGRSIERGVYTYTTSLLEFIDLICPGISSWVYPGALFRRELENLVTNLDDSVGYDGHREGIIARTQQITNILSMAVRLSIHHGYTNVLRSETNGTVHVLPAEAIDFFLNVCLAFTSRVSAFFSRYNDIASLGDVEKPVVAAYKKVKSIYETAVDFQNNKQIRPPSMRLYTLLFTVMLQRNWTVSNSADLLRVFNSTTEGVQLDTFDPVTRVKSPGPWMTKTAEQIGLLKGTKNKITNAAFTYSVLLQIAACTMFLETMTARVKNSGTRTEPL